ncbi:hypothetical protein NBRC116592_36730 [Colwellia sp. KU-HH00111]|uniref:CDP-glycerol glycerophosphotransferase family protein n=1 Tax=Colwellia sp. KU-HH00111 TaxID=3127652 RepID=UPI0031093FD3
MIGKKLCLHHALSFISRLFHNKKNIILNAPFKHHSVHLEPIIPHLIESKEYNVILIGTFNEYKGIKSYDSLTDLPIHKHYDIYISTEFVFPPWWLITKKVFFGHGIGPKLGYQGESALDFFDYSFAPCQPIFDLHSQRDVNVKKIGLPLLDIVPNVDSKEVYQEYNLSTDKPYVLYAPSWNADQSLISDIKSIIKKLETFKNHHVIISPHPNLLKQNMCDGNDYFGSISLPLNKSSNKFSTFELCVGAEVVISDISSILFEAMAINKRVYFDGNERVYQASGAIEILNAMKKVIPTLNWGADMELEFTSLSINNAFINEYLFNIGNSSKAFLQAIRTI